jgi:toxin ParE1/3/4
MKQKEKKMSLYKLTPAAKEDLKGIWKYTESKWGEIQADNYLKSIEKSIVELVASPEKGRRREEIRKGYRSFSQGKHLIFYRIHEKQIEVIRILHQKMDVKSQFEEE